MSRVQVVHVLSGENISLFFSCLIPLSHSPDISLSPWLSCFVGAVLTPQLSFWEQSDRYHVFKVLRAHLQGQALMAK